MESIQPNALPNTLSTEKVLSFVWSLLLKLRRRDVLSREESLLVEPIRTGSRTYGDPILAATSQQDLSDRIAAVVEASGFQTYWQGLMTSVVGMGDGLWKSIQRAQNSTDSLEILQSVLSGGALPRAEQALKYLETSARLMPLVMKSLREMGPEVLSVSLMDLIYDQDIPTEVAEAIYESQCGTVATFAINAAVLRGEMLEPWLSIGLAERWARGLKNGLRLLSADAAIAAELPESVLPRDERLDPSAVNARHAQVKEAFRALNQAAERAGAPVYPSGL